MTTCSRRASSVARKKLYGASWSDAPDASFPQAMPNRTDLTLAKRASDRSGLPGRVLDHVCLQHRPSRDRRADGCAGQGGARESRHQGRDPEEAGRRVQHARIRQDDAVSSRTRRRRGCLIPTTSSISTSPATSAGISRAGRAPAWRISHARCAVSDRPGQIRRRLPQDDRAVRQHQTPLIMLWQPNQDAVMGSVAGKLHLRVSTGRPISGS